MNFIHYPCNDLRQVEFNEQSLSVRERFVQANNKLKQNADQDGVSERLRHTINWTKAATPDNKRRPRGAVGAEIYVKLDGPPPTDEKQCTFLTVDSSTPYVAQFEGTDAGLMAHYMLRWRMRDGSVGAWSETLSATITG